MRKDRERKVLPSSGEEDFKKVQSGRGTASDLMWPDG